MLRRAAAAYTRALERRPLATQAVQSAVLFAAGDAVAQLGVEDAARLDGRRMLRLAAFGGCVAGPSMHVFYRALQSRVRLGTQARSVLARVAVDQAVFAPTFLALFFAWHPVVMGRGVAAARTAVAEQWRGAIWANYAVWPAVQLVNFWVVPLQHRVLVVNAVALAWNAFLSTRQHAGAA